MTVTIVHKNLHGRKWTGLSTDTKPTPPVDIAFAEFFEADTGRIHHWVINEWRLNTIFKNYSFVSPTGSTGTFYSAGEYTAPAADVNLNQGSLTATVGTANVAYGAHAFLVAKEAGSVDIGVVSIVVSGTSITDGGVETPGDSQTIVPDITALSANQYVETTKKWTGTITFTLTEASGNPGTYNVDFNPGLAKYEDLGNRSFHITDFEITGRGGASDPGFDVKLFKHSSTGWTYNASAFVPGGTVLASWVTDHATDPNLANLQSFSWKRDNINAQDIDGAGEEGFVVAIITGANRAVEQSDIHVGVDFI